MGQREHVLRDTVTGVLVLVVGAAIAAFAALPTRVSLVEQSQSDIRKVVDRMDVKLDKLLERRGR